MKINIAIIRLSCSRIWEEIWNIYEMGKAVKYTWLKKEKNKKERKKTGWVLKVNKNKSEDLL